jgi:hypothetical protein
LFLQIGRQALAGNAGKLVTVGHSSADEELRLSRFLTNGDIDTSFAGGGSVLYPFAGAGLFEPTSRSTPKTASWSPSW